MFIREWGSGDKIALVLHGLAGSSLSWHKLGQALADMGYHVIAPDLSGHGYSGRDSFGYSVEKWSQDILSLGIIAPDLLIGHSIGGLIAANISSALNARKVILLDPVLRLPKSRMLLWGVQQSFSHAMIRRLRLRLTDKRWDRADNIAEHRGIQRWDRRAAQALKANRAETFKLFHATSPSTLLIRARRSYIFPSSFLKLKLHEGIQHSYFRNSGHNIHCDSYLDLLLLIKSFTQPKEMTTI